MCADARGAALPACPLRVYRDTHAALSPGPARKSRVAFSFHAAPDTRSGAEPAQRPGTAPAPPDKRDEGAGADGAAETKVGSDGI